MPTLQLTTHSLNAVLSCPRPATSTEGVGPWTAESYVSWLIPYRLTLIWIMYTAQYTHCLLVTTRRAMYVQRYIVTRSRYYCWHRKATISLSLSFVAVKNTKMSSIVMRMQEWVTLLCFISYCCTYKISWVCVCIIVLVVCIIVSVCLYYRVSCLYYRECVSVLSC